MSTYCPLLNSVLDDKGMREFLDQVVHNQEDEREERIRKWAKQLADAPLGPNGYAEVSLLLQQPSQVGYYYMSPSAYHTNTSSFGRITVRLPPFARGFARQMLAEEIIRETLEKQGL